MKGKWLAGLHDILACLAIVMAFGTEQDFQNLSQWREII